MDNRLEKLNFPHVVKDAKLVVGFSTSGAKLDGMSHKHGLIAKVFSKWWRLKSNFGLFSKRNSFPQLVL